MSRRRCWLRSGPTLNVGNPVYGQGSWRNMAEEDHPAHADSRMLPQSWPIDGPSVSRVRRGIGEAVVPAMVCRTCGEFRHPHPRYYCPLCGLVQCGRPYWSGGLYVRDHQKAVVEEGTVRHYFEMRRCGGGRVTEEDRAP